MMRYFTTYLFLLLTFPVQGDEVPHAIIQTNLGIIEVRLNPEKAPETVENFLTYVKEGFYENTIFHRVVNNFIIQGGGYSLDYQKKPTHPSIPNEAANGLKNLRGTLAMARTADPHSSTSQFFINVKDNKFLDYKSSTSSGWGYCVFGKVVDGMDVVDKIARLSTDAAGPFRRDVPQTPVIIEAIKVEYVSVPGEEAASGSEKTGKSAHQNKNVSHDEASATKQAPSLNEMQQDMLTDLEEMDEEATKEESSSKPKEEENKKPKEEEEDKKPKEEEENQKPKEVSKSALHDRGNLSQPSSPQGSEETNTPSSEKEPGEKGVLKNEPLEEEPTESEKFTQDQETPEVDKKSSPSLKSTQTESEVEENKALLSLTKPKNSPPPVLPNKEAKKTTTPPDPPTLPDKPEPPIN